jgi:flagellar hook-associated protein 3 FlgL
MRVTDKMIFERANVANGAARDKLQEAVAQASSGLKLEHAWDDPANNAPVVAHRLAITRFEAIEKVAGRTSDELVAADNALGGISETLSRARELAVQLASDSYSGADRAGAAAEVRQLLSHTVGLLNSQVGNRFIFGGNKDATPPFDAAGNYLGDTGVRRVEVFPGVLQDASIRADVVAKGVGGGVDVLAALDTLATAFAANDVTTIRASLTTLDQGITQVSVGRAQGGAAMNTVDVAVAAARRAADGETEAISGLTDVDVFEAASRLQLAQRALEASLSAAVRSFDLSLLKKLG